jgi:hypothetical protein
MPVDTSLYANRTPPDPIADLGGTVGLANALTQNQILNAENQLTQGNLQGQGQFGQALIDANGNPVAAMNRLAGPGGNLNPLYAGTAYSNAAALQGAQAGNTNIIAAGSDAQSAAEIARLNAIANDGQPNPYARMLKQAQTDLWSGTIGGAAFHSVVDQMPKGDQAATRYVSMKAQGTVGAPQQATPIVAGYNPVSLAPIVKPTAAVNAKAAQPGGTEIEPPPGVVSTSAADKAIFQKAQNDAAGIQTQNRNLEALLPIMDHLKNSDFGTGSAEYAKLKSVATTMGIVGDQDTTLTGRQIANKLMNAIVSGSPHASDAGMSLDQVSKPNMDVTKSADVHIVKQLLGWGNMDAAKTQMYQIDAKPGQSFSDYNSGYYNKYDPDAFHYKTATPEERAEILASKGYTQGKSGPAPPKPSSPQFGDYQKFIHTMSVAQKAGALPAPAGANQ